MEKGQDIGHSIEVRQVQTKAKDARIEDFVLEKSIFNNIFEKDIRKVFIYKKAERLAKAIHLIEPAFSEYVSLRNRIDAVAVGLIDAAIISSGSIRASLSRELLALSSILSIARSGDLLSPMNAEIIMREAHSLLQEIAEYEEPRMFLEDMPTLSDIAKNVPARASHKTTSSETPRRSGQKRIKDISVGKAHIKDRRETILSVIKNRQKASIKDISTLIRGISEKTVQRELAALIEEGVILKKGERRWSTYSLA